MPRPFAAEPAVSRSMLANVARMLVVPAVLTTAAAPCLAQKSSGGIVEPARDSASRLRPFRVNIDPIVPMATSPDGVVGGPSPRGDCPTTVSTYTDASFEGGTYVVQSGFAQEEVAAVSFVLPADAFPVKLNMAEMIFATMNANVTTTTQWSLLVWEGTPSTGTLQFEFNSDGKILPHIVIPPGSNGVNVQVFVDPNDPEQIILQDPGNHTFSIGYRIDRHNNQTQNPCVVAPPTSSNAFPTTDTSGLSNSANNWLFGVNCGPFGCPANGGWARFSALPTVCRPSGDWVIRATWESVNCGGAVGACCLNTGGCEILTETACTTAGGVYQGDNVLCGNVNCPPAPQACCFESTGGCLNLTPANCLAAGGVPGGPGTTCQTHVCFPSGACCLPDGACIGPVSPAECADQQGVFQGDSTECGSVNCPIPTGACCFSTEFCLILTEVDCSTGGGAYQGDGSGCDACKPSCPCDFDGSGSLNSQDFFDFLSCFFKTGCTDADFNADMQVNSQDFFDFLSCFFTPPGGC